MLSRVPTWLRLVSNEAIQSLLFRLMLFTNKLTMRLCCGTVSNASAMTVYTLVQWTNRSCRGDLGRIRTVEFNLNEVYEGRVR